REATGDHEFIRARLQGPLLAILESYRAGTRRGVRVSAEGLLAHEDAANPLGAGAREEEGAPPRRGYAVEVQALWYNALLVGADLARAAGQSARAGEWAAVAARARRAPARPGPSWPRSTSTRSSASTARRPRRRPGAGWTASRRAWRRGRWPPCPRPSRPSPPIVPWAPWPPRARWRSCCASSRASAGVP